MLALKDLLEQLNSLSENQALQKDPSGGYKTINTDVVTVKADENKPVLTDLQISELPEPLRSRLPTGLFMLSKSTNDFIRTTAEKRIKITRHVELELNNLACPEVADPRVAAFMKDWGKMESFHERKIHYSLFQLFAKHLLGIELPNLFNGSLKGFIRRDLVLVPLQMFGEHNYPLFVPVLIEEDDKMSSLVRIQKSVVGEECKMQRGNSLSPLSLSDITSFTRRLRCATNEEIIAYCAIEIYAYLYQ